MTQEETITIMAMLGAFYSNGKNDPKTQAKAWHMVIGEYDFITVREAVLNFAKNDMREYASFPAVGVIVNEIHVINNRRERPVKEIIHHIMTGLEYYGLSADAMKLISEPQYNEWLKIDAEVFATKVNDYAEVLRRRRDGSDISVGSITANALARLGER